MTRPASSSDRQLGKPKRRPGHRKLYAVWTDNRDGLHDVASPVTDTNVFMAWSDDEGVTWHQPVR
jgi:hypothetical protein